MLKGKISEIFSSIQGEGPYQGFSQVFIRFYGCNLHCRYCDTRLTNYQELKINDITTEINRYHNYHSVSLTGGEPLLQIDFLAELLKGLKQLRKISYLETNGVLYRNLVKIIKYVDIIAMDLKLPSATRMPAFWKEHENFLNIARKKEVFAKMVVTSDTIREDILTAVALIKKSGPAIEAVLQPEYSEESRLAEKLSSWETLCREEGIRVRVLGQLHKKMGVK